MVLMSSPTNNNLPVSGQQQQHNSLQNPSQHPQPMRPLSLIGPEREPVQFHVNLLGAPPEVEQLVDHIKTVAEQFLYHWRSFPIGNIFRSYIYFDIKLYFSGILIVVLPQPLSAFTAPPTQRNTPNCHLTSSGNSSCASGGDVGVGVVNNNSAGIRKTPSRPFHLRDLFVSPPFDELDAVASDNNGEPRRLTNSQLKTLRENG